LPRYRAALLLTILLLSGCTDDDRPAAGGAASKAPESATTSASATTPTAEPFPYTVDRRGGFAGVDDHAEVAADGTAVVTTGSGSPATKSTVPVATMDELRRLLTSPDFTGRTASPDVPACNDGFEYEMVTPAAGVTVHDCGTSHGPTIDRLLQISAGLFNA
jgi:hypothetical protein